MANNTTVNPLFFDAPGTVSGARRVIAILWQSHGSADNDIAADDDFEVQNGNGDVIVCKRAETTADCLELVFGYPGFYVDGLNVATLDGGVCLIYTR